jgi:hypothetical protein
MRRDQRLGHCAAYYPTQSNLFGISQESCDSQHRILKPSLFLQLALLTLLAVFFPGAKLHAQSGSITGTVVDPSGAAIPGAQVQLTNQATGDLTREATSDATGTFRALNVPPGTYKIKVTAAGMEELDRNGVVLDQDQSLGLGQVALTLGQATQTVTVSTQTPLIDTATSSNAAVVDERQVTEQPLNGRDFESLLTTLPGVVTNNNSQFRLVFNQTDDFYVNGMRGTANNFFLDGIINTDVGANDGEYTAPSLDAVGEFKTLTGNFNAEYGRSPGVMILINIKSGGEHFHGTAWEFNRNTAYNANDWFSNHQGSARPILKFNQFGGNIGGYIPIPKVSPRSDKKAFFFFNYEGTRANRPNGATYYTVPQPSMLGIGTPNGQADLSPVYRSGNLCDFNGTANCTPIHDTNGNLVQNGQVFVPGTVKYNSVGEIETGTPYAGNIIPASQFNSQYAAMIKYFTPAYKGSFTHPTYNNGFGDEQQVNFQDTYTFTKNQYIVRVDYNFGPKANAFFRYVDDRQQESDGYGIFSGNSFPVLPQYRKKPGKSYGWSLVNVISPTLTNEATVGWLHLTQVVDIVPGTSKSLYDKTALGFTFSDIYPSTNTHNLAPNINTGDGYINISPFPSGWTSTGNTLVATDDVTKVLGSHVIKFGLFADLNENGQEGTWTENPNLNFGASNENPFNSNSGIGNTLLGNYTTVSQSNIFAYGHFHFFQYEGYAQDTWKATPRLTVDAGVRYEFIGPTYTTGQYHQYYFVPGAYNPADAVAINTAPNVPGQAPTQGSIITGSGNPYNGMIQEGTNGLPKGGINFRWNNFGPRLGFAYDVFGDGKTALRGGVGVFFERQQQNVFNFGGISNPPTVYTPTVYGGNIANISPSLANGAPLTPSGGILSADRAGQIPTTYGYNLGLQRELPLKLVFDIGYVGNTSRHQVYVQELEQLPLGLTTSTPILSTVNNVGAAILPYKGYSSIHFTRFGADSAYNALQVKLTRRFSKTLTINTDYTWSKAIDLFDQDNQPDDIPDQAQIHKFYAPAGFDRRNVFNFQYVYDLPNFDGHSKLVKLTAGGWEYSGVTQFWSGSPCLNGDSPTDDACDLTSSGNLGNGGFGHIRPDYIGGPIKTAHSHSQPAGQNPMWFNPAAFASPAPGSFGDFHRNSIYGPGILNFNMSLFKNFNFTENTRIQLRLEAFNVFNHTQWANINNSLSAPTNGTSFANYAGSSGQITSARDPRQLQLAGKFYF